MLKKKNIYVITISVIVIFLVILSSFLGLIIYLQWRQLKVAYGYYETLEELDTISYARFVDVDSLKIRSGFRKLMLIEGQIKNKGKRVVVLAALNVKFLDSADGTVYNSVIYPMEPFRPPRFFKKMRFTPLAFLKGHFIEPNKAFLFKYPLWQCPKKFARMLAKGSFSNKPGEWSGRVAAEVVRIKLKPI